jgi:ribulose-phosphate 3-epimerase
MTQPGVRPPQISASILNADFANLGEEVRRAVAGGVDSIHLDVMDGHFVPNITLGPVVVEALRPESTVPFHSHLMIDQPLRYVDEFTRAGSDLIVFHVEAEGDPRETIRRIHGIGRQAGLALNPETPGEVAEPYLDEIDLLLVMTVHPGFGGQDFITDVLPKIGGLRAEALRRGLDLPIGVDGGVNDETIGSAYAAGGDILIVGSGLYRHPGDLGPVVAELRAAARAGRPATISASHASS